MAAHEDEVVLQMSSEVQRPMSSRKTTNRRSHLQTFCQVCLTFSKNLFLHTFKLHLVLKSNCLTFEDNYSQGLVVRDKESRNRLTKTAYFLSKVSQTVSLQSMN